MLWLIAIALFSWLLCGAALCVIVAGASRGLKKSTNDGGKSLGRGH